jgi:hypothetical protein
MLSLSLSECRSNATNFKNRASLSRSVTSGDIAFACEPACLTQGLP